MISTAQWKSLARSSRLSYTHSLCSNYWQLEDRSNTSQLLSSCTGACPVSSAMDKALIKTDDEHMIKPQSYTPAVDTSDWPLLLKNYSSLLIRTGHFTPIPHGCTPLKRDLKAYISSGVINLDKPANPSSHEVVAWVKRMLRQVPSIGLFPSRY